MTGFKKGKIPYAWILLAGICVFMGLARGGINNAGGLFMAPVMEELNCSAGEFALYFSISSLVTLLFLPAAGRRMRKHDIRLLLIASLLLQAGAFALLGLMNHIWGWYLLSVPMAIGSILTTQIAGPVLIGNWFKKNVGLATGIMMAAVGFFGAVLQPLAGNLIASAGWRKTYFVLGALVMAVGIPTVLLTIRMSPQQKGLLPWGEGQTEKGEKPAIVREISARNARKTVAFWALVFFMFFIAAAASFAQHIPKYAEQLGFGTVFAGNAMGFFMLGVLAGSMAFGMLSDQIGAQSAAVLALTCGLAAILTLIFWGGHPALFNVAVMIFGFSSAAVGTLGPLMTTAIFGRKEYSEIYSVIAMGMALAGMVSISGYGFLFDALNSYIPVLWSICGMLGICLLCVFMAFADKRRKEKAGTWS